jgi:hypothetical protein
VGRNEKSNYFVVLCFIFLCVSEFIYFFFLVFIFWDGICVGVLGIKFQYGFFFSHVSCLHGFGNRSDE